ncbi:MAG: transaldolase family protein [Anaerolineae bacterium]|nr:hypothetical protein [Anaerolineae bacterium]MDW8100492.1 transaldolase family protein [Anaerolineae bacterium]
MSIPELLKERIRAERQQWEAFTNEELLRMIQQGKTQQALDGLIFFTPPGRFRFTWNWLRQRIQHEFDSAVIPRQEAFLRFGARLFLALSSFLPRWNLQNPAFHGELALTDEQVAALAREAYAFTASLSSRAPHVALEFLSSERREAVARLKAEGVANPEAEARALIGNSVGEYLTNLSAELARSNLRRIAEMRLAGETITEISNDYAAFLPYALYLGASFVTCNPTLVDIAWAADPGYWTLIVDEILAAHPDADHDALARRVTLEIVFANMRLLRPIFLLTEGEMGCVSLQVNPHKHGDAATMVADALAIYEELQCKLDGGVPNVVFKLPATRAGLEACSVLTRRGIGVTITVNFGLFQHLRFAEVIQEGAAIFSTLAHMSGRLAYPVRDELLSNLGELSRHGISEAAAREAAAWSGVAILKRLYAWMKAKGFDLRRIRPLIASLRVYEGDGYESLPSAFPDITEALGTSIITVFPNVRRAFDCRRGIALDPRRIEEPVPTAVLEVLAHSEIFKQAYYVADPAWGMTDQDRFRPRQILALEDEDAVAAWTPVRNTLTEFSNSYDSLVKRILERKQVLMERVASRQ